MTSAAPSAESALRHAFAQATARAPGADELAFYAQHLATAGPSLAAMCATGELLLPLTAAGHNVHGVDSSALAIAACEAQLAQRGLAAPLFRQALPELNLPFRYGTAFIAAGALQRIVDPVLAFTALSRLRAHLVAPMTLVVECLLPPEALHAPGAPVVEVRTATAPDGAQIVWRSETRVDVEGRRVDRSDRFEKRAGRAIVSREDDRSALVWYAREDLDALLHNVGFAQVDTDVPHWQDPSGAGQRIVAIARG